MLVDKKNCFDFLTDFDICNYCQVQNFMIFWNSEEEILNFRLFLDCCVIFQIENDFILKNEDDVIFQSEEDSLCVFGYNFEFIGALFVRCTECIEH